MNFELDDIVEIISDCSDKNIRGHITEIDASSAWVSIPSKFVTNKNNMHHIEKGRSKMFFFSELKLIKKQG